MPTQLQVVISNTIATLEAPKKFVFDVEIVKTVYVRFVVTPRMSE